MNLLNNLCLFFDLELGHTSYNYFSKYYSRIFVCELTEENLCVCFLFALSIAGMLKRLNRLVCLIQIMRGEVFFFLRCNSLRYEKGATALVYKYPKKLLSSNVDDVAVAFICAFHLFN